MVRFFKYKGVNSVTETMIWIYWLNNLEPAIRKPPIQILLWPGLGPERV